MRRKLGRILALVTVLTLIIPLITVLPRSAAAQGTPQANTSISGTINIAMVANPQMVTLEDLVKKGEFKKLYPNIKVNLLVLPENEIRQRITTDISTQAGQFDAVTIGNYEVPLWAKQGWLADIGSDLAKDQSYDLNDVFQSMRSAVSYEGKQYAAPFYGESSMVFYRKDLFQKAGLQMPEHPTWDQIAQFAQKLDNRNGGPYGICLRGLPGWGEQGAALTSVINAFGGRWFDNDWTAQLNSPASAQAIKFYVDLVKNYGEPNAVSSGFTECENLFDQGKVAMWYDATSAADFISSPKNNPHAANVGYAYQPTEKIASGWLWTWSFAIEKGSKNKDAALAFIKWATSKDFVNLVANTPGMGWGAAPAGCRQSTYENPGYHKYAARFADLVLNTIKAQNPDKPTVDPVPYTGLQFVQIPEFQDLGNNVTQEIAGAIAGKESVDTAIKKVNDLANQMAEQNGYK